MYDRGYKVVLRDTAKMLKEGLRISFGSEYHNPDDGTLIFEHFDSNESLKRWTPNADSSSLNGFSVAKLTRSPAGHALFHGILDHRIPDDGITQTCGFAGIMGSTTFSITPFYTVSHWDWSKFNYLEIKVRGDGRKYTIAINTGSPNNDLSYYDCYIYPIHTKGGPYWQTFRIPFSKFIFTYKGLVQDRQDPFHPKQVQFMAITIKDTYDGPFALEIDYIGLGVNMIEQDSESPYENYTFAHIKGRPLQVECDPPDPSPR